MNIRTIQNKLKTIAKDAGVKKNIHPHAFRHGRLTDLVKQGFKEMELRIIAGWGSDSAMPATYIHLSGDDVDKKQLQIAGFKDDETEAIQDDIKPVECPRCKTKNPHDAKYCSTCSMVLDAKTAVQLEAATRTADNSMTDIISSQFDDIKEEIIDRMLRNLKN